MTKKEKHLWLIDTLSRSKRLTLNEISLKWRDYINGPVDYKFSRATFNRWVHEIYEEFKLNIVCDRSYNEYYIENPEVIEDDMLKKWMLDTFVTGNIINENFNMSHRILVPHIPSGKEVLGSIIHAMKENHKIIVTFKKFGENFTSKFTIEPYCVKLFEGRWYLLGKNNLGFERIFGLDRILEVEESEDKFNLPKGFDAEEYFRPFYGVMLESGEKPQRIVIRTYENNKHYLSTLPIHDSQTLIEDTAEYADFELYVVPTYDFFWKLLSYGGLIEVIKPESVRKKMINQVSQVAQLYNLSANIQDNAPIKSDNSNPSQLNGNFAVIDVEIANGSRSSICSIALVVVRERKIVDRFYSLVEPSPNYYTDWTSEVHGLTRKETDGKPKFPQVWAQVADLIKELPLVSHNSRFVESCIKAAFAEYGMEYPEYKFYDTLKASRQKLNLSNHQLDKVAKACGYNVIDHNPLTDADATVAIALKIL